MRISDWSSDVCSSDLPRIDLVGDDPDAVRPREVEDGPLLVAVHRPAGRIARRVEEDDPRAVVAGGEQTVDVQAPDTVLQVERHEPSLRTAGFGGADAVRTDWRHANRVIAGSQDSEHGERE